MKSLVGFWLICEAITFVIVDLCAIELDTKDKVKMILTITIFLIMLCIGSYLMVGDR